MNWDTLRAMRNNADQALQELQNQVAPLLQEIERKKKEISLLDELLRLETGNGTLTGADAGQQAARTSRTHTDVIECAKQILSDAGGPLHVSELHRFFLERGFIIPGQGKQANIIAHIGRSPDIVRIKRGYYVLADSVGPKSED